jgi:hypothetical protein
MEEERMMAHDEIAAQSVRLLHDFLVDVQTQKCP